MIDRPTKYCDTHKAWAVLVRPWAWCHTVQNRTVLCRIASTSEVDE